MIIKQEKRKKESSKLDQYIRVTFECFKTKSIGFKVTLKVNWNSLGVIEWLQFIRGYERM